mgnify:CR=1 FL=1
MQDFISKESETSAFIEAKAVALIYCLIKKNDIFHLSEMRKQELHSPPPYIGEVSRSDGGVENRGKRSVLGSNHSPTVSRSITEYSV